MPDILHLVRIKATPSRIYEALTTPEGIRSWWTRNADLAPGIGGVGEFRFYNGTSSTRICIEDLHPAQKVVWKTLESDAPGGWNGTLITFDLQPDGEETVLRFSQRGFVQENDGFALVNTGWAYYLVSLRQYLETGKGAPQQDKDFARMLN